MAEETKTPATPVAPVEEKPTEQTTANPLAVAQNIETPADVMIPKARFDEVNKKLRDLEAAANAQEKAAAKAEEERMATQAEWQKLSESRKAKIDELMPQAELAVKLTEVVTAQYAAEIKEWPEQVKAMAPDDEADILTKLAWMAKAKPLAVEMMGDKAPTPGNPRRPTPVSPAGTGAAVEKVRADQGKWTRNNF